MKLSFKKLPLIAILIFSLLISGCQQQIDSDIDTDTDSTDAENPIVTRSESENINVELAAGSTVSINLSNQHRHINCDDVHAAKIIGLLNSLQSLDLTEFTLSYDTQWEVAVQNDSGVSRYTRYLSDKGYIIVDSYMNCYSDSTDLSNAVIEGITVDGSDNPDSAGNVGSADNNSTAYYTIDYPEPNNDEEYRKAGIACTDAWLKSLQGEDVDEYYRNKGFEITEEDDWGRTKCNYLSCGIVDGRKEFVVEICFIAKDCGDNTFYDKYYQEGRYTEAGTYWSGQYICGRFCWEEGKCSFLRFTTRDGSSKIQEGLNGVQQGEYKNFFDFARRSDLQEAIDTSFVPYGLNVSRNLTQTEDGKPINIDIYTSRADSEDAAAYTAIWDKRAYINGKPTYSTGLYFTDGGTGHMPDTLPKSFSLTFDNYDGDANPDFCVRYDNDENGTFYVLNSIQTDGRIFNLSGRAFEGGIYIAGCTDPSPRLQKTDDIPYVGWKVDNGRYYPTDENGNETELPDLNMYSDRYYLPDSLKFYSQDENTVTCFLWNNTAGSVTADNKYSIEYMENGQWKMAAENLSAKNVTVNPREHAEITYDISALKTRYNTYYRIVQQCGGLTAYGNFCLEGEKVSNVEYTAENLTAGQDIGMFTVSDKGISLSSSVPKTLLAKDGAAEYPLTILHSLTRCYSDEIIEYCYNANNLPQTAGDYVLVIDGEEACGFKVTERENFPHFSVKAEIKDGTAEFALTCDRDAELESFTILRKDKKGFNYFPFDTDDYSENILKASQTLSVKTVNYFSDDNFDEDSIKYLYEIIMEGLSEADELSDEELEYMEDMGLTPDMDYEGFKEAIIKYCSISEESTYMVQILYAAGENTYHKCLVF